MPSKERIGIKKVLHYGKRSSIFGDGLNPLAFGEDELDDRLSPFGFDIERPISPFVFGGEPIEELHFYRRLILWRWPPRPAHCDLVQHREIRN